MAENFYTILTNTGKAKIANATALGTKVNFATLKVGDSSGNYYNPTETQENLVHTVWQGNINSITTDPENPNWIVVEVVIPSNVGGFTIREVGIFDDEGDMLAIGKYPETYKPQVADGGTKDITIRMILEVSNSASVTLKVDPTVTLATKEDFNALAGTGRTTETVKKNADNIKDMKEEINTLTESGQTNADAIVNAVEDLDSHKADTTKHLPPDGAVGQIVQKQSEGWGLVDLPPAKDVDNGRYQAEWGLDDAELSDTINSTNGTMSLLNSAIAQSTHTISNVSAVTGNAGLAIQPKRTIHQLKLKLSPLCTNGDRLNIYNKTDSISLISNQTVTPGSEVVLDITLQKGKIYHIGVDDSANVGLQAPRITQSFPLIFDNFNIVYGLSGNNGIIADGMETMDIRCFDYVIAISNAQTSGTATKPYAPSDIHKWGNVKVKAANLGANNSATATVKSSADVQLKAPVTLSNGGNYIDISDIDSLTYPSLKIVFTLSRNSVEDESPSIKDVSVTWEGKYNGDGAWQKIADVTLTSDTAQIEFSGLLPDFNSFLFMGRGLLTDRTSTASGALIFNDDVDTGSYNNSLGYLPLSNLVYYKNGTDSSHGDFTIDIDNLLGFYKNIKYNLTVPNGYADGFEFWKNNSKINKITFKVFSGKIKAGAKFILWGCK